MENREAWLTKLNVLYVEDETVVRENVSQFLQRRFRNVYTAENGQEGLNLYKVKRPHIVITDVKMPVMDGLEMTRQIRKVNPDAQVIVTTAHSETELLIKAIDVGVSQFVIKPITRQKLFEAIGRTLHTILLQEKDDYQTKLMQKIIDSQDNMIIVAGEKGIIAANQAALSFFRYGSLKEFAQEHASIRDFLLEEDGCFFPRTANWHQEVHGACKVRIQDRRTREDRYFVLRMNSFPYGENFFIMTMTDMTDIEQQNKELERLATTDPLTGLHNRAKCTYLLGREIQVAKRYKTSLSMVMLAIDYREDLENTMGRESSDEVLLELTGLIQKNIRGFDLLGRWDEEELVIIAPNSTLTVVQNLCHRLREIIARHRFPFVEDITCSYGIAQMGSDEDAASLSRKVFDALDTARAHARNTIVSAPSMEVVSSDLEALKENEMIIRSFDLVKAKNQEVTFFNLFKGMSISGSARVSLVSENEVEFALPQKQFLAVISEKRAFIESDFFAKPVQARVKRFNKDESRVILRDFSFEENSAKKRQYVRVQVPDRVRLSLEYDGKTLQERIFDISLAALAFYTSQTEWLREGMDASVRVQLHRATDGQESQISTKGRIYRIEGEGKISKVVVMLQSDTQSRETLKEYIAQRQIEIVRELNNSIV